MVSSFREVPKETAPAKPALPVQAPVDTGIDYRTIAIAAGAGILLFLLILFLIFGRRRRRQMKEDQELFEMCIRDRHYVNQAGIWVP